MRKKDFFYEELNFVKILTCSYRIKMTKIDTMDEESSVL